MSTASNIAYFLLSSVFDDPLDADLVQHVNTYGDNFVIHSKKPSVEQTIQPKIMSTASNVAYFLLSSVFDDPLDADLVQHVNTYGDSLEPTMVTRSNIEIERETSTVSASPADIQDAFRRIYDTYINPHQPAPTIIASTVPSNQNNGGVEQEESVTATTISDAESDNEEEDYHNVIVPVKPPPSPRRRISKTRIVLNSDIRPLDVLLGQKGCRNHLGNASHRKLVKARLDAYKNATTRMDKTLLSEEVVDAVAEAGGRFLKRTNDGHIHSNAPWEELNATEARYKVAYTFRGMLKRVKDTRDRL